MTLFERLAAQTVSEQQKDTTRRIFFGRAAKVGAVLAGAVAGLAGTGSAFAETRAGGRICRHVGCCGLAYCTSCPCRGCCRSCQTKWAWYCTTSSGQVWECGECYANGCAGCSWAYPGL